MIKHVGLLEKLLYHLDYTFVHIVLNGQKVKSSDHFFIQKLDFFILKRYNINS